MPEIIARNRWRKGAIALAAVVACALIAVISPALALYLLVAALGAPASRRLSGRRGGAAYGGGGETPPAQPARTPAFHYILIVAMPLFFTGPALILNRAYGP
ncbi:MAG: hypothetical protein ACJ74H_02285, partial [Thermoanaerobaculia bacterium]